MISKNKTVGFLLVVLAAVGCAAIAEPDPGQKEDSLRMKVSKLAASGKLSSFSISDFGNPEFNSNRFWEEITDCGFYPQETRLECTLVIKQRFGYGGPVGAFGSFEYVKFCVDWDGNGVFATSPTLGSVEGVGHGIVHMHDESAGNSPPWHYAVYRDIDPPGGPRTVLGGGPTTTVSAGDTLLARAILSWTFEPTDCNYVPIWGEVFDFRIRLDPIR